MNADKQTPAKYLVKVAKVAIREGKSEEQFLAIFRPEIQAAAGRAYRAHLKLCKDCTEPMEDQTTRRRICDACRQERDQYQDELRGSRMQK